MNKPLIIYLSPYDILRPRTNQVSDVRFSEGFAQNNCEVHFITPYVFRADNIEKKQISKIYGLQFVLNIHFLATKFKTDVSGKFRTAFVALLSFFKTIDILKKRKENQDVYIISRSAFLLRPVLAARNLFLINKKVKIIFWAHDFKTSKIFLNTYKNSDFIFATNSAILNDLCKATGIARENTIATLNPITEAQATEKISKSEAREKTGLSNITKPLIVYTGKIGIDYNLELKFILQSAKLLPDYQFLFTGGKPEAVKHWEKYCAAENIKNIIFTGYIPDYSQIKYYQYSADILVSYYTKQGHDLRYNLPNKLCEYMLTGNVIITPDYPATADFLTSNNCIFAPAENAEGLAETIRYAVENKRESLEKTRHARKDVEQITFKKRTALLLGFLNNKK